MQILKTLWIAGGLYWVLSVSISCKSNQPAGKTDDLQQLVREKLGPDFESIPNTTNEYVLFVKRIRDEEDRQANRFIIVELSTASLVDDKLYIPGYVKWKSTYEVEYLSMPGIIKENEDLTDYIKILPVRKANH